MDAVCVIFSALLLSVICSSNVSNLVIPEYLECVDAACNAPLSHGKVLSSFQSTEPAYLSYERDDEVAILGKSTEKIWLAQSLKTGEKGLVNRAAVEEKSIISPHTFHKVRTQNLLKNVPDFRNHPAAGIAQPVPGEDNSVTGGETSSETSNEAVGDASNQPSDTSVPPDDTQQPPEGVPPAELNPGDNTESLMEAGEGAQALHEPPNPATPHQTDANQGGVDAGHQNPDGLHPGDAFASKGTLPNGGDDEDEGFGEGDDNDDSPEDTGSPVVQPPTNQEQPEVNKPDISVSSPNGVNLEMSAGAGEGTQPVEATPSYEVIDGTTLYLDDLEDSPYTQAPEMMHDPGIVQPTPVGNDQGQTGIHLEPTPPTHSLPLNSHQEPTPSLPPQPQRHLSLPSDPDLDQNKMADYVKILSQHKQYEGKPEQIIAEIYKLIKNPVHRRGFQKPERDLKPGTDMPPTDEKVEESTPAPVKARKGSETREQLDREPPINGQEQVTLEIESPNEATDSDLVDQDQQEGNTQEHQVFEDAQIQAENLDQRDIDQPTQEQRHPGTEIPSESPDTEIPTIEGHLPVDDLVNEVDAEIAKEESDQHDNFPPPADHQDAQHQPPQMQEADLLADHDDANDIASNELDQMQGESTDQQDEGFFEDNHEDGDLVDNIALNDHNQFQEEAPQDQYEEFVEDNQVEDHLGDQNDADNIALNDQNLDPPPDQYEAFVDDNQAGDRPGDQNNADDIALNDQDSPPEQYEAYIEEIHVEHGQIQIDPEVDQQLEVDETLLNRDHESLSRDSMQAHQAEPTVVVASQQFQKDANTVSNQQPEEQVVDANSEQQPPGGEKVPDIEQKPAQEAGQSVQEETQPGDFHFNNGNRDEQLTVEIDLDLFKQQQEHADEVTHGDQVPDVDPHHPGRTDTKSSGQMDEPEPVTPSRGRLNRRFTRTFSDTNDDDDGVTVEVEEENEVDFAQQNSTSSFLDVMEDFLLSTTNSLWPMIMTINQFCEPAIEMLPEGVQEVVLRSDLLGIPWSMVIVLQIVAIMFTSFVFTCCFCGNRKTKALLIAHRQELETVEGQCRDTKDALDMNTAMWRKSHLELTQIKKNYKNMEKENKQSVALRADLERKQEAAMIQLNGERDKYDRIQTELSQAQKKIKEVEQSSLEISQENSSLVQRIQELEQNHQDANDNNSELKQENEKMHQENQELLASSKMMDEKVTSLNEKVIDLQEKLEKHEESNKELETNLQDKTNEIEVLKDCLVQMKGNQTDEDGTEVDNEQHVRQLLDTSKVIAKNALMEKELEKLRQELDAVNTQIREHELKQSADQHTMEALRQENKKVKFEKEEASTKLSVLQEYFKTKEIDMQRKIGMEEAQRLQTDSKLCKESDSKAAIIGERNSLLKKNKDLHDEMEKTKIHHKEDMQAYDKKAHEAWLAVRAADRQVKELERENAGLRHKLTNLEGALDYTSSRGAPSPFHPGDRGLPPRRGPSRNSMHHTPPPMDSPPPIFDGPLPPRGPPPPHFDDRYTPSPRMDFGPPPHRGSPSPPPFGGRGGPSPGFRGPPGPPPPHMDDPRYGRPYGPGPPFHDGMRPGSRGPRPPFDGPPGPPHPYDGPPGPHLFDGPRPPFDGPPFDGPPGPFGPRGPPPPGPHRGFPPGPPPPHGFPPGPPPPHGRGPPPPWRSGPRTSSPVEESGASNQQQGPPPSSQQQA